MQVVETGALVVIAVHCKSDDKQDHVQTVNFVFLGSAAAGGNCHTIFFEINISVLVSPSTAFGIWECPPASTYVKLAGYILLCRCRLLHPPTPPHFMIGGILLFASFQVQFTARLWRCCRTEAGTRGHCAAESRTGVSE